MSHDFANEGEAAEIAAKATAYSHGAARDSFLDQACAGRPALRVLVETSLRSAETGDVTSDGSLAPRSTIRLEFASEETPDERIGEMIGPYRLLEKLGEGGCGVVYAVQQNAPVRRRAALKVIKLGMDTKAVVARFEAERQALAMMDHPGIARVLDAGATAQGRPYFVMELVRGIRITDYCDQHKLSTEQRLGLFVEVCRAIQHAHQKGIIHRDIKPSNILVAMSENQPVPKVIDFGIAKATAGRLADATVYTQVNQFIGTPAYMSPEQAEFSSLDIDTRSDIYSLGVLLYQLLTGCIPFDAVNLMSGGLDQMRRTIRETEPLRPSSTLTNLQSDRLEAAAQQRSSDPTRLMNQLAGDLDWIVMKCLEKDRTRRYETANGLALDIGRFLNNEPVLARPPSVGYRLGKAWKRHRVYFAAGVGAVMVLLAGTAFSIWQAHLATNARLIAVGAQRSEKEQRIAAQAERDKAREAQSEASRNLYFAHLNLAQTDWQNNSLTRLERLLDQTRSSPERGFEWDFWKRLCQLERFSFDAHRNPVFLVATSPKGTTAASLDRSSVRVWDYSSGAPRATLSLPEEIMGMAWHPDGEELAVITGAGVRTWNPGRSLPGPLIPIPASDPLLLSLNITSPVKYCHDGKCLALPVTNGVRIVSLATGQEQRFFGAGEDLLTAFDVSRDGRQVVAGSYPKNVAYLWDTESATPPLRLVGHQASVMATVFSPDGSRLLTGGDDNVAKLWDTGTGQELFTLTGHAEWVTGVAFSPDGRLAATSGDPLILVWEVATGRQLFRLKGHTHRVRSVAFSSDGKYLIGGSEDGTAKVWDLRDRSLTRVPEPEIHRQLALSADGSVMLTAGMDGVVCIRDGGTGAIKFQVQHGASVWKAAVSPDGRIGATQGRNETILWETSTGRIASRHVRRPAEHDLGEAAIAFSPDSRAIVVGHGDGSVTFHETGSGALTNTRKLSSAPITAIAFSPDGSLLVTGNVDGEVGVWDVAQARSVMTKRIGGRWVMGLVFSPDGSRCAISTHDVDNTLVVETKSWGQVARLLGHTSQIHSIAFAPDGRRIATGSDDNLVKLWDPVTGQETLTFHPECAEVWSVVFSPDGRRLLLGCSNGIRIMETAAD